MTPECTWSRTQLSGWEELRVTLQWPGCPFSTSVWNYRCLKPWCPQERLVLASWVGPVTVCLYVLFLEWPWGYKLGYLGIYNLIIYSKFYFLFYDFSFLVCNFSSFIALCNWVWAKFSDCKSKLGLPFFFKLSMLFSRFTSSLTFYQYFIPF